MGRKVTMTWEGGERMNKMLAGMRKRIGGGKVLRVGFLEGATYPPEHPVRGGKQFSGSVAQVAFWNEFGTKTSPPRPFFRGWINDKSKEWGPALGLALKAKNYDAQKAMKLLGSGMADQLVASINNFSSPPNSPRTIAIKGFNAPLRDSMVMALAVDSEVVKA